MGHPLAYYNENDAFAAAWLRELIAAGLIAPGDVDERDIRDVRPADLSGYRQCHFFAGIGGWSAALRLAGWPDDRAVWTGSCPCQPLSGAGKRKGHADERHLWPAFYRLIAERGPTEILGEQVASNLGREWLAAVRADLEDLGYACGAADLCSPSVGAPNIRPRIFWLAHLRRARLSIAERETLRAARGRQEGGATAERSGAPAGWLGDAELRRRHKGEPRDSRREVAPGLRPATAGSGRNAPPDPLDGFWRDADWLLCRDGRWRPVEPGTLPLAARVPARVGRLRGYGNAINRELGAAFASACLDLIAEG